MSPTAEPSPHRWISLAGSARRAFVQAQPLASSPINCSDQCDNQAHNYLLWTFYLLHIAWINLRNNAKLSQEHSSSAQISKNSFCAKQTSYLDFIYDSYINPIVGVEHLDCTGCVLCTWYDPLLLTCRYLRHDCSLSFHSHILLDQQFLAAQKCSREALCYKPKEHAGAQ